MYQYFNLVLVWRLIFSREEQGHHNDVNRDEASISPDEIVQLILTKVNFIQFLNFFQIY